jgi:solute carrier family 20 (sodium-dependent phosphate transporter)
MYIAAFFELLGAVTLGRGVSEKLQEGVSDITDKNCWACGYCNSQISVYDLGMLGSLISGAIFLLIATATSLPVSTTHAIVGAIVGMTISNLGPSCVNWTFAGVGGIFASWVISPILSGVLAVFFHKIVIFFIFESSEPSVRILRALPWIFSLVCFVMFILILTKSPSIQVLVLVLSSLLCSPSTSPLELSFCLSSLSPPQLWSVLSFNSSHFLKLKLRSPLERTPSPIMA